MIAIIAVHSTEKATRENHGPTSSLVNWQDNPYHSPLTWRTVDGDIPSTLADNLPRAEESPVTCGHPPVPNPEGWVKNMG